MSPEIFGAMSLIERHRKAASKRQRNRGYAAVRLKRRHQSKIQKLTHRVERLGGRP